MAYGDSTHCVMRSMLNAAKEFYSLKDARQFPNGYTLRESDGDFFFGTENYAEHNLSEATTVEEVLNKSNDISNNKMITYHKTNEVTIDFDTVFDHGNTRGARHRSYLSDRMVNMVSEYLPEWIYLWSKSDGGRFKMFTSFNPDLTDARSHAGSPYYTGSLCPLVIYEIPHEGTVKYSPASDKFPNGNITNAKKINRGKTIWAEDKPLSQHLEPKHYKEMAKARLNSDLAISVESHYATFRGIPTGLRHVVLEMYKPSSYGNNGPNEGLIRRLSVARFIDSSNETMDKAYQLAASIAAELPASLMQGELIKLVDSIQS
jgi:hypothetical protein